MDPVALRLECLRLARPDGVNNPDAKQIVARARDFLAFVNEGNPEAVTASPPRRGRPPKALTAEA